MKNINLPCFGITLTIAGNSGLVSSDLQDDNDSEEFQAAMKAVESLILAMAVAGIDVESPAMSEAIEKAVDTISNNLGE